MEKYGLVIPADTQGDYTAIGRYNDLIEAEEAFNACQTPGKALVRYDRIGPCSWIGVTIKE